MGRIVNGQQIMSRVLLFLALTVSVVANVVAIALCWSSVNEIIDDNSSSDTSVSTGGVGAGLISASAGHTFCLVVVLFVGLLATCDLDYVDDSDFFRLLLRLRGFFAVMSLVGAGLLIAGLTTSYVDNGPFTQGVIAVVGAVIAACADIVLAWVGTPEGRKEAFKDFFCKQCRTGSYASIDN